jgi:hypothetical protein
MASGTAKPVVCAACGFKNAGSASRCASCGATLESGAPRSRQDPKSRQTHQQGFSVVWCLISAAVLAVLTGALVIGLPMVVTALDFEGSNGMLLSIPVWFLGGMLVGMISPGRTFVEPVVAAVFVVIPTVAYLVSSQTVRTMPLFMYVIMGAIGVMFTMVGSYLGERIQMGPPPKPAE